MFFVHGNACRLAAVGTFREDVGASGHLTRVKPTRCQHARRRRDNQVGQWRHWRRGWCRRQLDEILKSIGVERTQTETQGDKRSATLHGKLKCERRRTLQRSPHRRTFGLAPCFLLHLQRPMPRKYYGKGSPLRSDSSTEGSAEREGRPAGWAATAGAWAAFREGAAGPEDLEADSAAVVAGSEADEEEDKAATAETVGWVVMDSCRLLPSTSWPVS